MRSGGVGGGGGGGEQARSVEGGVRVGSRG